jgi:hypothetical protein
MRILALAGLFGLALVASGEIITVAHASPLATRYCMRERLGTENCGFYSFRQCRAAAAGNGGICSLDTLQPEVVNVYRPRGNYWIVRGAFD